MPYKEKFEQQGYLSPIDVVNEDQVVAHRIALERAEKQLGALRCRLHTHDSGLITNQTVGKYICPK